jgi:hypothetical protein
MAAGLLKPSHAHPSVIRRFVTQPPAKYRRVEAACHAFVFRGLLRPARHRLGSQARRLQQGVRAEGDRVNGLGRHGRRGATIQTALRHALFADERRPTRLPEMTGCKDAPPPQPGLLRRVRKANGFRQRNIRRNLLQIKRANHFIVIESQATASGPIVLISDEDRMRPSDSSPSTPPRRARRKLWA